MSEHRNISAPPHSQAQGPSFPFAKSEFKDTCHFTLGHRDLFPSITSFQLNAIIHWCMYLFHYHVRAGELRSLGASVFLDTVVTVAEGSPRTRGMTGHMIYSWCLTLAKTSQLLGNPFQNVRKFPSKLPIAALPNHHYPQIHKSTPPPSLEINQDQHMWTSSPSFRFSVILPSPLSPTWAAREVQESGQDHGQHPDRPWAGEGCGCQPLAGK